jgi:hypothetical protein
MKTYGGSKYCSAGQIEKNEMGGACGTYEGEAYTGFWWVHLKERDHLEDSDVDGRIILTCILRKWDVGAWTGSSWLRIGTDGWHL